MRNQGVANVVHKSVQKGFKSRTPLECSILFSTE